MSTVIANALRGMLRATPGKAVSEFTFTLPPKSITVSIHPHQISWWTKEPLMTRFALPPASFSTSYDSEQLQWWCSGRLNKTTKLARKKARRRAGERVPLRYR